MPSIVVKGVNPGDIYNKVSVEVVAVEDSAGQQIGVEVVITKPTEKLTLQNEKPLRFSSLDYPLFGQLCDAAQRSPVE